jgi:serpin B
MELPCKRFLASTVLLALAGAPGCHPASTPAPTCSVPQGSSAAAAALAAGNTEFALAFFPPAAKAVGPGQNVILSTYGVTAVLSMLDVGARGDTAAQIESALSLPGNGTAIAPAYAALTCEDETAGSADSNQLSIANAVWGQKGMSFQPGFLSTLAKGYAAPLQQADFADAFGATSAINHWVSTETRGAIPTLFQPGDLDATVRVVLVNAIYFKGQWATSFDPGATQAEPFTLDDGSQVMVPTMQGAVTASQGTGDGFTLVELPYQGGAMAMDILLPTGKLAALEASLTPGAFSGALGNLSSGEVQLRLPKFSFQTRLVLNPVLTGLGIRNLFDAGTADLSGIDNARDLYVSLVVQQAMIEVDEQGTVAAAATGGVATTKLAPEVLAIDHPFLFLLRDIKTGSLLFTGHVEDPRAGSPG